MLYDCVCCTVYTLCYLIVYLQSTVVEDDRGYPTFLIQLIPKLDEQSRTWEMKCDFEEDFEMWIKVLKAGK